MVARARKSNGQRFDLNWQYYSAVRVSVLLSGPCFRLDIQETTQRSVFPLRHRSNYSAVCALLARAYIKSSRHTSSHSLIQLFENLTQIMSGRGKVGNGLGKGGAKRHRKVLRDNIHLEDSSHRVV